MSRLRVAFVVQGEGRGHMTQALALAPLLRDAGHEVDSVLVGQSPFRSVPDYFVKGIKAPVETFPAPTQVPGRMRQGVSVLKTLGDATRRMPQFISSGFQIHNATRSVDVVVNFMDLICGLSRIILRSRVPAVAVAHNYLFLHPELTHHQTGPNFGTFVMGYTKGTAGRSMAKVALSFDALANYDRDGLVVMPPLLRPGLRDMQPSDNGYLLAYALNPGYGYRLAELQSRHPEVTVHFYVDGGSAAFDPNTDASFHVHALNDQNFIRHLAGCRAYIGSAGFESICEAFHFGKPILAVPTEGQHEQILNAWDAERVGAAQAGTYADLDSFWDNLPRPSEQAVETFRRWVEKAPPRIVEVIERAARQGEG